MAIELGMAESSINRRAVLKQLAALGGAAVFSPLVLAGKVGAAPAGGVYGWLEPPNELGLRLPKGFSARVVATTGQTVENTNFVWHAAPDGGACFPAGDGGWIYVSNAEIGGGAGGASMVRFAADGTIVEAKTVLSGTSRNCSGGPTPWGTWLSCEEQGGGEVWECDPTGQSPAVVHPGMGRFNHEAAVVDPVGQAVYLTEDRSDGGLYRFVPTAYPDLSAGVLEVMTESNGALGWATVPTPGGGEANPTRTQVPTMKVFNRGEGAFFVEGVLYFATTGDNTVWTYQPATNELDQVYKRSNSSQPVLSGADNLTATTAGDVFVCEDGGNMELVMIPPEGGANAFMRVIGQDGSEITGVAFDPSGTRMYLSSQRPGTTYEITGPFRTSVGAGFTCSLNQGELTWNDQGVGTYYIRGLDAAGNSTYLGSTSGLSFSVSGTHATYVVRYWSLGQPFDAECPGDPGGVPDFACSLDGGVLSWNDQDANNYFIRALDGAGNSSYLGQTAGLTFDVSGNDAGYLVRHWVAGQPVDAIC